MQHRDQAGAWQHLFHHPVARVAQHQYVLLLVNSLQFYELDPGSDLRIYPELRHEIFNEPEKESVLADLLEWIRKREVG